MKKLFLLAFSVLSFLQSAVCQYTIQGAIFEMVSKTPVNSAHIYLNDLKIGTITDSAGGYKISNLRSGSYLVEVSAVGYKSIIASIPITKDTVVNFTLTPATKELTEVVVTAVSRSTELKRSPVVMTTIDAIALRESSAMNAVDALAQVPGVNQLTTGVSISKPMIRGLGYNRVITLNNGMRQEGQQWGDEHGIEIDAYGIDRVEIVKGPGSLLYGSDGIAGVINFLAPKAPPVGEISTHFVSEYQSNNGLIGNSISNSGNVKGIHWAGRLSLKQAGNYQNRFDGKVYNSGFDEQDASLHMAVNKKWGFTGITLSAYNTQLNLVEGERDSTGRFTFTEESGNLISAQEIHLRGYKTGFPHQGVRHLSAVSNSLFILKKGTLHTSIGFQNNQRKEFADIQQPEDIELFFNLNTVNYNFKYNLQPIGGWEATVGVGGMVQQNENRGEEVLIPEYGIWDAGVFVFTQKEFNNLTVAGGLRFDNRLAASDQLILDSLDQPIAELEDGATEKFQAVSRDFQGVSGSIGLAYQMSEHSTLKLNVSRGFRAPNMAELASNGRHEGTFRYEIGSASLKSEISHQLDLAYFYNSDHLSLELSPFVNWIDQFVYTKKLVSNSGGDSIPNLDDPAPAFAFTQAQALLSGGEIYFDLHPHPLDWLHFEQSFAYVQAVQLGNADSTRYLPFIPAPNYRGEVKAQFKTVGSKLTNVYLKFGVDYFFKQHQIFSAYGTETKTPDYLLMNAGVGTMIKAFKQKDRICVYLSAQNLGNVAYQSHLSRLKYAPANPATGRVGVFNMGRNFSFKMILNF